MAHGGFVIPAKAGIHEHGLREPDAAVFMDPGLRRDDGLAGHLSPGDERQFVSGSGLSGLGVNPFLRLHTASILGPETRSVEGCLGWRGVR